MNFHSLILQLEMREKDPNKLAAIYKATLKTVLREGFSGLKMGSVAKEAGIATGTMYVYFESKEDRSTNCTWN